MEHATDQNTGANVCVRYVYFVAMFKFLVVNSNQKPVYLRAGQEVTPAHNVTEVRFIEARVSK